MVNCKDGVIDSIDDSGIFLFVVITVIIAAFFVIKCVVGGVIGAIYGTSFIECGFKIIVVNAVVGAVRFESQVVRAIERGVFGGVVEMVSEDAVVCARDKQYCHFFVKSQGVIFYGDELRVEKINSPCAEGEVGCFDLDVCRIQDFNASVEGSECGIFDDNEFGVLDGDGDLGSFRFPPEAAVLNEDEGVGIDDANIILFLSDHDLVFDSVRVFSGSGALNNSRRIAFDSVIADSNRERYDSGLARDRWG